MYAPFHSSRAVCTPGRCSGAWSLLFYKKGTCLSRGFHQLFTKEWGWGQGGRGVLPAPAFPFFSAPYPPCPLPGGKGENQSFLMQGASPLASPALNRLRHSQSLPSRCPAEGLPGWSPAYPAFSLLFRPLSPQPPSPTGKGENQSFLMQGASPLAFPRLNPCGTYRTCQAGTRRGLARLVACLPCLSLSFFPLSPHPPSPAGMGEIFSLFRRGLRPRHPCA